MTRSLELEALKSIDRKMDQVFQLLVLNAVKGMDEIDQIKMLRRIDLSFPDIGRYLGMSGTATRLRLRRAKMTKKGGKRGKK